MKNISLAILLVVTASLSSCLQDKLTPPYPYTYTDLKGKIFLNEVYTYGNEGDKSDLDYIELYNPGDEDIDLSRLLIYESGGIEEAFTIPDGTKIAPKGYWTLFCDKTKVDPAKAFYGLSKNYDQIFLVDSKGILLDYVETPNMIKGQVLGRSADGAGNWIIYTQKTIGATNVGAPIYEGFVRTLPIYVNEAFIFDRDALDKDGFDEPEFVTIDNDELTDWVEFYNAGDEPINMSGFRVDDDASEDKVIGEKGGAFIMPVGSIIPAGGFFIVEFDKNNLDGTKATMGLGRSGDRVILSREVNGERVILDDISIPAFYNAKEFKSAILNKTNGKYYKATECEYKYSFGRATDGSETLSKLKYFTKNRSNNTSSAVAGAQLIEVSAP